ncbi:MAG: FAD:protein FMN transferase [Cytophagales bacterium]|nr:FAD:protein FMN transferase [Cytophagales bacterium]
MPSRAIRVIGVLLFAIAFVYFIRLSNSDEPTQQEFTGQTMGTIPYTVKVISKESLPISYGIDSVLKAFNQSLSTYIPDSEISTFNRLDSLVYESEMFYPVLEKSREIHEATAGAFDPTVGPLVNIWGFGPDKSIDVPDSTQIDSLLRLTGFDRILFNTSFVAKQPGMYLDFSAIAKGYAIDLVAEFVEAKGVTNYLVEIGGELRARGKNLKNESWSIGIDDPLVAKNERKILSILELNNLSLATSGNYRNYYEKDGVVYAHIIDPRTGYNRTHNLLSASVFSSDCMTADAYATGFMVMGLKASIKVVEQDPGLEALLLFQENGEIKSYVSPGLKPAIKVLNSSNWEQ